MANLLGGLPGWFGNKGSNNAIEELNNRNMQRECAIRQMEAEKNLEIEKQRAEYVRQLQNQYANNLTNNLYGNQAAIAGILTTGTVTGTAPQGIGNYYPTTAGGYVTMTSTSSFPVWTQHQQIPPQAGWSHIINPVTPGAVIPDAAKGDCVEFEFDGSEWKVKTEKRAAKKIDRHHGLKGDFSLDELDEAEKMIESLRGKEQEFAQESA